MGSQSVGIGPKTSCKKTLIFRAFTTQLKSVTKADKNHHKRSESRPVLPIYIHIIRITKLSSEIKISKIKPETEIGLLDGNFEKKKNLTKSNNRSEFYTSPIISSSKLHCCFQGWTAVHSVTWFVKVNLII